MDNNELNRLIAEEKKRLITAGIIVGAGLLLSMLLNTAVGFIMAVIGLILLLNSRRKLKTTVGAEAARVVIKKYIDDAFFDQNSGIDEALIRKADMGFPGYDRIKCGDYIKGSYHGHDIELCDLNLSELRTVRHGKTTSTRYVTVFQGPYMRISYDKELSSPVTLTKRYQLLSGNQVKLESEEFNRKYKVYCDSEHDAFYILTPHMMERIESVHEKAADDIYINFCNDGHVYIAIDNKRDSFEVSLRDKSIEEIEKRFNRELSYPLSVIDELMGGLGEGYTHFPVV